MRNPFVKHWRRLLTAALAVVAVVAFSAVPAQASDSYHSMNTPNGAGSMSFTEHGDRVWVYDGAPDGHSVWVQVSIGANDFQYGIGASPYGGETIRSAADGGVFNLPENYTICFDIWLMKSGEGPTQHNSKCWYNDY